MAMRTQMDPLSIANTLRFDAGVLGAFASELGVEPDSATTLAAALALKLEAAGILAYKAGVPAQNTDTALFVWDTRAANVGGGRLYTKQSDGSFAVVPVGAGGSGGADETARQGVAKNAGDITALQTRSDEGDQVDFVMASTSASLAADLTGQETENRPKVLLVSLPSTTAFIESPTHSTGRLRDGQILYLHPRSSSFEMGPRFVQHKNLSYIFHEVDAAADVTRLLNGQPGNPAFLVIEPIADFSVTIQTVDTPMKVGEIWLASPYGTTIHRFSSLQDALARLGIGQPQLVVTPASGRIGIQNVADFDGDYWAEIDNLPDRFINATRYTLNVAEADGTILGGTSVHDQSGWTYNPKLEFAFNVSDAEEAMARIQQVLADTPGYANFVLRFWENNVNIGDNYFYEMPINAVFVAPGGVTPEQESLINLGNVVFWVPAFGAGIQTARNFSVGMEQIPGSFPTATKVRINVGGFNLGDPVTYDPNQTRQTFARSITALQMSDIQDNIGLTVGNLIPVSVTLLTAGDAVVKAFNLYAPVNPASSGGGGGGATPQQAAAIAANTTGRTANAAAIATNLTAINTERTQRTNADTALGRRIDGIRVGDSVIKFGNPTDLVTNPVEEGTILAFGSDPLKLYVPHFKELILRDIAASDFRQSGLRWRGISADQTARNAISSPQNNDVTFVFGPSVFAARTWQRWNGSGWELLRTDWIPAMWSAFDTLAEATAAVSDVGRVVLTADGTEGATQRIDGARWVLLSRPDEVRTIIYDAAIEFNANKSHIQEVTLTGNTVLTMINGEDGGTALLRAHQDISGARTIAFRGIEGTAPQLSTAGSATDLLFFHKIGNNWHFITAALNV